jgi:hypothetical protein
LPASCINVDGAEVGQGRSGDNCWIAGHYHWNEFIANDSWSEDRFNAVVYHEGDADRDVTGLEPSNGARRS